LPIDWTTPKTDKELSSARKEATLAYTEFIIHKNRNILREQDKKLLRQFTAKLLSLLPLFNLHGPIVGEIQNLVDFAAHTKPERSGTNVLSRFVVYYRGRVNGIGKLDVTRREVLQMRNLRGVGVGSSSATSRSYGLLTGEVYQLVARRILERLTVDGQKVRQVIPPAKVHRPGKRVDDWLMITTNGRKILGEVKVSRGLTYFDKAFGQIATMREYGSRGVFVGFSLSGKPDEPKKVLVILVKKSDTLTEFRKSVREMLGRTR
jgi:hypothetical protein